MSNSYYEQKLEELERERVKNAAASGEPLAKLLEEGKD